VTSETSAQRVVVSEFGENPVEAIDTLTRLEAQERPDPSQLNPGDAIIAIRSASVGWVDLLMTSGQYQHMPKPPYTPGLEYSGVVDWAGADVTHVAVGDAVMVDPFQVGPRSYGEYQASGGFAHYSIVPGSALIAKPDSFSFDQAANFYGNYETAYHCLFARGRLKAGESVLIHGASGSTGLAAVHLAKIAGATVIATGRTQSKLDVVKAQGADHVINTKGEDGNMRKFREDVKALTDGKGVDVVYDGVGGEISVESMRCVKFGARFLIVGWAATPFVAKGKGQRGAPNANMLPTNLMMMKGLDVLGSPTVISTKMDPSIRKERLGQLMTWVADGSIKPYVSHTFPLSDYKEAMHLKWNSKVVGGCVLHPV